jgi:cell division transport system permease protein
MHRHLVHHIKRIVAPRLDLPFSRDDANRFLPWIITLMVCLTGIFLAGGITVGEILNLKKANLSQWITVQVPADERITPKMIDSITKTLRDYEGIESVEVLDKSKAGELLAPWFGKTDITKTLPLPTIMEARLKDDAEIDVAKLSASLKTHHAGIDVDGHEYWADHYLHFIRLLEYGAYLLAMLVIAATIVMIVFTSKTALKLHQHAIWLLHSLGAPDDYIARQFQFNAFLLGVRGALIGTAFAAALFFLIGILTSQFDAPLLPALPITGWHVFMWLSLPLLTGLLTMWVARKTVLSMLLKIA